MGQATQISTPQFYRLSQLKARLNVSGSSIWAWSKSGKNGFPKPVKLAENTTAWEVSAVEAWAQSRIEASK